MLILKIICFLSFNCEFHFAHFRGSRGPFLDPNDPNSKVLLGILTGIGLVSLVGLYQTQYREITWKEFLSLYLTRNIVSNSICWFFFLMNSICFLICWNCYFVCVVLRIQYIFVCMYFLLQVEKLEVINKKWVRVKLLSGSQVDSSVSHHFILKPLENDSF